MAFPNQHAFPGGVPLWTLANHVLAAGDRVEATPFEQGEDRHREIYTFTHYRASVATKPLTQAEFDRFARWFRVELQGGTRRFDVPVHSLEGEGVQWWEALFVGAYRWQARAARYLVTAELLLLDGPYAGGSGPGTPGDTRVAPSAYARGYVDFDGTVRADAGTARAWGDADTDGQVEIDVSAYAWGDADTDGTVTVASDLLLLDGAIGYLLLEGGTDRIILEQ